MHVALVLAQIDATRRTITAIVFALLAVAAGLALLTAWYWRITDPRRAGEPKRTPPPRRRRTEADITPEQDPSPGGATVASSAVHAAPGSAVAKDETRLMDRDAILDGVQKPEPNASARAPVIHQPAAPEDTAPEVVIDLRHPADAPGPEDTSVPERVISGAHDEGLSLEQWLALGEED